MVQKATTSPDSDQSVAAGEAQRWALSLFSKSLLKQAKLKHLQEMLGDYRGLHCLDLGSDNGVISYYLRQGGGEWVSADLTQQAVDSIRSLVGGRVELLSDEKLPFDDSCFDAVVVVDMLEHVEDDRLLVSEIARILKPTGIALFNVPNLKRFSLLRGLRRLIGQTDEAHGHLRPGYSAKQLEQLLSDFFVLQDQKTYSRFFVELIDTAIVFAYGLLAGKSKSSDAEEVSKGLVVTEEGLAKQARNFKLYSAIYPIVRLFSQLDYLIFWIPGFMRIARARKL